MARGKKKGRSASRTQRALQPSAKDGAASASTNREGVRGHIKLIFAFVAPSGLLALLLPHVYRWFTRDISLEFEGTVGRAYEFRLKNEMPYDVTISEFRVEAPSFQDVVYEITENVYAEMGADGRWHLPGGNSNRVPAVEFTGLNGQTIAADSSEKVRIPPLSDRDWITPKAALVDVRFTASASNILLSAIEKLLKACGLKPGSQTIRYLVVDNYWSRANSDSLTAAVQAWCNEDESARMDKLCNARSAQ